MRLPSLRRTVLGTPPPSLANQLEMLSRRKSKDECWEPQHLTSKKARFYHPIFSLSLAITNQPHDSLVGTGSSWRFSSDGNNLDNSRNGSEWRNSSSFAGRNSDVPHQHTDRSQLEGSYRRWEGLTIEKGFVLFRERVVIPTAQGSKVPKRLHQGYPGILRMNSLAGK
jgi:hypothetical protein